MLAALPTYETIAEVLSDDHGAGLRLAGWTVGRAALITPGICMVGVPFRQAALGSVAASSFLSVLALMRFSYIARKDVPMKTVFWLGLLGASAIAIYYATEKEQEGVVLAPPDVQNVLLDDSSVSPPMPEDPFARRGLAGPGGGLRAIRAPRFRGAY